MKALPDPELGRADSPAFRRGLMFGLTLAELFLLLVFMVILAFSALLAEQARRGKKVEDPPIVTLSEAEGFYFPTGSPELSPAFRRQLTKGVAPRLREIARTYDAYIVEVVGHTDEVPVSSGSKRGSDLDRQLGPWLTGASKITPVASDNVGLGMARAVAVTRALRQAPLGPEFTVVPLSAGPFLRPDDTVQVGGFATGDEHRRRIEIRLRRRLERRPAVHVRP